MYEPNVARILEILQPNDLVLDIGGWACPFNRANFILDAEPYETRGFYGTFGGTPYQGGDKEYFTHDTWIQRDICEKTPFPFADKELDFVVCSHTLEDLRDPLWVCSEMIRIGKRGYIEVPARIHETCRGWENPYQAGLSHHRWLIEIEGKHIKFFMKYHMIHTSNRFSFSPSFLAQLPLERTVQWLFWQDAFGYSEVIIHGIENQAAELERFVRQVLGSEDKPGQLVTKIGMQGTEELAATMIEPALIQDRLKAVEHELAAIHGSRAWKIAKKLQQVYRFFSFK